MSIQVSVVVPTFKRPDLLQRCLEALMAQDFDPAAYEVIVADDAASAETEAVVQAQAAVAAPRLRYLAVTGQHGPAAARNQGWQAAEGAIIAFTDDDCLPEPDWLRAGVAAFEAEVAGVSGRVIVPLPASPTDYERDAAGLEQTEFVTANCFYRREALAAVGGFDERFTAAWREDSDLFFALLARGSRLAYAPAARVVHPVRPARWGVSLSQQRKSFFNALLYKKHPDFYRQYIQAGPPGHYYSILAALGLAFSGVMGRCRWLALGATGVWLFLTGRFCRRRLRHNSRALSHVSEMVVTSALIPPLAVFWRIWGALKFRVVFF
ncbi:MAG TPA: glycosyltransferase [Anaerolineae bacterium]|nr:glycosyltransferase [Anaerolineae bacterium]